MAIYTAPFYRYLQYDIDGTLFVDSTGTTLTDPTLAYMNNNDRTQSYQLAANTTIYMYFPIAFNTVFFSPSFFQFQHYIWGTGIAASSISIAVSGNSTQPANGTWPGNTLFAFSGNSTNVAAPTTDDWYRTMSTAGFSLNVNPIQAVRITNSNSNPINITSFRIGYGDLATTPTYITGSGVTNNAITFFRDGSAGGAGPTTYVNGGNTDSSQGLDFDFQDIMRNTAITVDGNTTYSWGKINASFVDYGPAMFWVYANAGNNKTANDITITPTNNGGSDSIASSMTLSVNGSTFFNTITIPTMAPGTRQKIWVRLLTGPTFTLGSNSCRLIPTVASWT